MGSRPEDCRGAESPRRQSEQEPDIHRQILVVPPREGVAVTGSTNQPNCGVVQIKVPTLRQRGLRVRIML